MLPHENLRYFGLYGLLLGTIAVIIMLYKWRGDTSMTLSLHAAAHRSAYLTMGVGATITALFIYPFLLLVVYAYLAAATSVWLVHRHRWPLSDSYWLDSR